MTPIERRARKAALDIESGEPGSVLYQHTVMCQTVLPYRDPGDEVRVWEQRNGDTRLKLLAGEAVHPAIGEFVDIGLPYGPKPRLILAHLNAVALRTNSPVIEVEDSLSAFVRRLGLHRNGRTLHTIKDQLARLSAASIRLGIAREGQAINIHTGIVGAFDLWLPPGENQRVLWPTTVTLSDAYFTSLTRHAVPLDERALVALSHTAMGLDIYAWLSQRLNRVLPGQRVFITWAALKEQFGGQYDRMDNFKPVFRGALQQVLDQYRGHASSSTNRV